MRMRPAVGSTKPAIRLSVMVFPQPDGPRRERNSPSSTARSSASTARTLPYARVQPWSSTTAFGTAFGTALAISVLEEDPAEAEIAVGEPDQEEGGQDEEARQRGDGGVG